MYISLLWNRFIKYFMLGKCTHSNRYNHSLDIFDTNSTIKKNDLLNNIILQFYSLVPDEYIVLKK